MGKSASSTLANPSRLLSNDDVLWRRKKSSLSQKKTDRRGRRWWYEPRHEKTCLQGLRQGKTQTGLFSYRDYMGLESFNLASVGIILSRKWTTKALIRLPRCADGFSHDMAHTGIISKISQLKRMFLSFFLPIHLNLRGGHQTGFSIQVQRGVGGEGVS